MITIADKEIREEEEVCRWNSNIVDLIYSLKKYEIASKKKRKKAQVLGKNPHNFFPFAICFHNF